MLMLLFVNKPVTFIFYVIGVCLMILLSFQDGNKFWFTSFWLIPAFSIFYFTSIPYYFLLREDNGFEIKGVNIRIFKSFVRVYWIFSIIGLIIGITMFAKTNILGFSAIFLVFYNAICAVILKSVIYAKFFSEALKKNSSLKDFKIDDLYTDFREVILKKIVN